MAPVVRSSREKRDAISLAIKDIKEAIEEVKTRTVRSPYTPDEPKEPIWVMRQDLSPTAESDLQPSLGADVSMSRTMQDVLLSLLLCCCTAVYSIIIAVVFTVLFIWYILAYKVTLKVLVLTKNVFLILMSFQTQDFLFLH